MSFDVCPECGFREDLKVRPLHNTMSHYVFENGKPAGVINSEQDIITPAKGGPILIRKDFLPTYLENQKKTPAVPPTPATPPPTK